MVGMLTIVGLAIDGGMAAGNYRVAQNATDSGALSMAERVYTTGGTVTTSQLCDSTTGYGPLELKHNRTNLIACHPEVLTTYGPSGPGSGGGSGSGSVSGVVGYTTSSALATIDTTTTVPLVANVTSHVGINETSGSVVGGTTPSASGSVDLASLNGSVTTLLGAVASANAGLYQCSSSQTGTGTNTAPPAGTACPVGNLAMTLLGVNVNNAIDMVPVAPPAPPALPPGLLQQQSTSTVTSTPTEQEDASSNVVQESLSQGGIAVTVNSGTTSSCLGICNGVPGVTGHASLVNVSANINGVLPIQLTGVDVSVSISYVPGVGFTVTPSCTVVAPNVYGGAGGAFINGVLTTITPTCGFAAVNRPGVANISSGVTTNACTASGGLVSCSASVCLLSVQLLGGPIPLLGGSLPSVTACIGSVKASATFAPVTFGGSGGGGAGPKVGQGAGWGAVLISGTVPTPTYFMSVVGVKSTSPAASAAAMPQQVIDETAAQFAADPYAVPYLNKPNGGGCTAVFGPLIPGCQYQLYGTGVSDTVADGACTPSTTGCWHGLLKTNSSHAAADPAASKSATPVSFDGSGDGPGIAANYGQYALLPVVDNSVTSQVVIQYGLFQLAADHHYGTLMKPIASGGTMPPVEEESALTWNPNGSGAVAIKLVDPATLTRLGYTPQ